MMSITLVDNIVGKHFALHKKQTKWLEICQISHHQFWLQCLIVRARILFTVRALRL